MTTLSSPGDYSQSMVIDFNTLSDRTESKRTNLKSAEKNRTYAIATLVAGTIATIALAIFTSPGFAIIAGVSTVSLTAYFVRKSIKHHATALADQMFLKPYIITKTHSMAAGDTYDDTILKNLYKSRKRPDDKVQFWNELPSELRPVYQHDLIKCWVVGTDLNK